MSRTTGSRFQRAAQPYQRRLLAQMHALCRGPGAPIASDYALVGIVPTNA